MLAAMSVEEFNERLAADLLDPINDSWRQMSLLAAVIVNKLTAISAAFAGGKLTKKDMLDAGSFTPEHALKPHDKPKPITADEVMQTWQSLVK